MSKCTPEKRFKKKILNKDFCEITSEAVAKILCSTSLGRYEFYYTTLRKMDPARRKCTCGNNYPLFKINTKKNRVYCARQVTSLKSKACCFLSFQLLLTAINASGFNVFNGKYKQACMVYQ